MLAGREMPHSLDAEAGLLACCILDGVDSISRCLEQKIVPEAFYSPAHRAIYEALLSLNERKAAIDTILLCEELKSAGTLESIGGPAFVIELSNRIATTAHLGHFIEIVREKYLLRRLIKTATSAVERCFNFSQEGLEDFIQEIEQEIFKISEDRYSDSARPIADSVSGAVNIIHKLLERGGELSGLSTGFKDLDTMTFGLHPQEMIVLAARPSMGKTSLAMNIAEAVVLPKKPGQKGKPVLVFSLEMSAEQLAMRMLTCRARVAAGRLRGGFATREEQERLAQAAVELKTAPLWIDDSGQLNIHELRAKARRLHSRHKLALIVIDYLQLIAGTDPRVPREQQIAEISRGIKILAKELHVPVIVLSQLNRESEKEKRQPRLSDLRESGSIEQDADLVLLLARPKDAKDDFSVATDHADLIIAKQRNGPVGEVRLTFLREITRFENFAE
ncbi:MAG: replicative DNA helicase [Verrucomicrobia bacterium]|nr:MAG: replicative DNA helicase [Verrucomicrobiota bacterium]